MPYWSRAITPAVSNGEQTLIVAHGNSLRALVKYLDDLLDEEVEELEIPPGYPLVYELGGDLEPARRYYLGDSD